MSDHKPEPETELSERTEAILSWCVVIFAGLAAINIAVIVLISWLRHA